MLSELSYLSGYINHAIDFPKKARDLDQTNPNILQMLIQMLNSDNRKLDALNLINNGIKDFPTNVDMLISAGLLESELKNYEVAKRHLEVCFKIRSSAIIA